MRKVMMRSLLAVLAIVAVCSTASASPIPIGQLQWLVVESNDAGAPVSGQFSVINQTGANWQNPEFPVLTQLLFDGDMNLEVHLAGQPPSVVNLGQGAMTSPDGGLSWDTDFFDPALPLFAQLTGHVNPTVATLNGSGVWNIIGTLFTVPGALGDDANPIEDGQTAIIYVEAIPAAPEPVTVLLLGTGLAGLAARRRLAAKR